MRQAKIYRKETLAGWLREDGGEYTFRYDDAYLASPSPIAISLTLPLQQEAYTSPAPPSVTPSNEWKKRSASIGWGGYEVIPFF